MYGLFAIGVDLSMNLQEVIDLTDELIRLNGEEGYCLSQSQGLNWLQQISKMLKNQLDIHVDDEIF